MREFPLAPMCRLIAALTAVLLAIPALLLAGALWTRVLLAPALLCGALYAWIWMRFRPTRFAVHPDRLEVIWPLKRRALARASITAVRQIDRREFNDRVGFAARVGAGGLWGGFGWLWTTRRGIVQMYVSRVDRFVWIERGAERPWIVTPASPEVFVEALAQRFE